MNNAKSIWYGGEQNICATTGHTGFSFGEAGKEIGCMNMQHGTASEDMERLIACHNALIGVETVVVKLFGNGGVDAMLRKQDARIVRLKAALRALLEYPDSGTPLHPGALVIEEVRATLNEE